MRSAFLIQTRNTGEPWTTRERRTTLLEASTTAAALAVEGVTYPGGRRFHRYGYVRILHAGSVEREWTPGRPV